MSRLCEGESIFCPLFPPSSSFLSFPLLFLAGARETTQCLALAASLVGGGAGRRGRRKSDAASSPRRKGKVLVDGEEIADTILTGNGNATEGTVILSRKVSFLQKRMIFFLPADLSIFATRAYFEVRSEDNVSLSSGNGEPAPPPFFAFPPFSLMRTERFGRESVEEYRVAGMRRK